MRNEKLSLSLKELSEMISKGQSTDEKLNQINFLLEEEERGRGRPPYPAGLVSQPFRAKGKIFSSFGEQLQAVYRAAQPGQLTDQRLFKVSEQRAALGLSEVVGSDAGYLVEDAYSKDLLKNINTTSIVAPLCKFYPVPQNSSGIKINAISETSRQSTRWGGIVSYWLAEAGTKTSSKPTFRQIELNLKKLIGLCYASDEVLQDAPLLERTIVDGFNQEFSFRIDDAIINGTGVGMPLGIMNSGCLISVARATAGNISITDITTMWSRLAPGCHGSSTWLCNATTLPEIYSLAATINTTGGQLVYMPPGGLSQTPYSTLFGRPLLIIEQCEELGTTGDIILGDFNNYLIASKGGIQQDMSIHVQFLTDQSVFRFVMRIDGQPAWNLPLTPAKSSTTVSPFICLTA